MFFFQSKLKWPEPKRMHQHNYNTVLYTTKVTLYLKDGSIKTFVAKDSLQSIYKNLRLCPVDGYDALRFVNEDSAKFDKLYYFKYITRERVPGCVDLEHFRAASNFVFKHKGETHVVPTENVSNLKYKIISKTEHEIEHYETI